MAKTLSLASQTLDPWQLKLGVDGDPSATPADLALGGSWLDQFYFASTAGASLPAPLSPSDAVPPAAASLAGDADVFVFEASSGPATPVYAPPVDQQGQAAAAPGLTFTLAGEVVQAHASPGVDGFGHPLPPYNSVLSTDVAAAAAPPKGEAAPASPSSPASAVLPADSPGFDDFGRPLPPYNSVLFQAGQADTLLFA